MKIGLVAATSFEIQPTIDFLSTGNAHQTNHLFEVLITGIGSIATTYNVLKFINSKSPDYLIQAGIGGSFSSRHQPGATVLIKDEITGDIGVEENNSFKDLFDMNFMDRQTKPYTDGRLQNPDVINWGSYGLPVVSGLTVNEITTNANRIRQLSEKYNCDIESMEGAAFHYVCLQENKLFLQLRSVSNYVGERDKTNWRLKDSIISLNQHLIKIIQNIL